MQVYRALSTNAILMIHREMQRALKEDDEIPSEQPKKYEARTLSDWKELAHIIESELALRGESYIPLGL
jgi:hypothetical protein